MCPKLEPFTLFDRPSLAAALAVSSSGKLFTWEDEGQFHVTETATGKVTRTCGPIKDMSSSASRYMLGQIAFSADETKLYVGSARGAVSIYDCQSGEELEQIGTTPNSAHVFAMGAGERFLAVPCEEFVRVFRRSREWEQRRRPDGSAARSRPR